MPIMPIKIIKILFAWLFAGHLLKANRVRSISRFSYAGWAMLYTMVKFFWLLYKYMRQRRKEKDSKVNQ